MSFDSPPVVECSEICFILICNVRESFHKLNCLFFTLYQTVCMKGKLL